MIKHIVMWRLKDKAEGGTAAQNAAKMKTMLEALKDTIAVLKDIEVGIDILEASPPCTVILHSAVATPADLETYQMHPNHQACLAFIKKVVAERRVVDYRI
ncbi:MAG: Dabb family protein [Desulfoplanes sp.]|nr:Dabb family protein [Desulfoplanes sp.]